LSWLASSAVWLQVFVTVSGQSITLSGTVHMVPFDQYSLLASRVVSTLRPDVEQKVAKLTSKFPTLSAAELRLRLWIVESIVVSLAAEDSTADPSRLDRFFGAFWSNISKEV